MAAVGAAEAESSDSEPEQEHGSPQKLIRKVSTSGQIRSKTILKEGKLMKQTNFQRWKRRYFKLRGRTLYYAQTAKSIIFDEVDLTDASVAESSTKNVNNSFTVITPCRRLVLCAENRKEMEEWIAALKSVQNREHFESTQFSMDHFSGMHNWYACSHARPTYCNVCREALSGVTSHGLSCEVCKFKAHKRCAVRATNNCKWTTLASIGKDILEDEDGISMPHQWLEGNLPVSAKCTVCDKTCGSVLRLQDWRCLWCKAMVHAGCKDQLSLKCPLGQCKVSVIPPTALNSIDSDGERPIRTVSQKQPIRTLSQRWPIRKNHLMETSALQCQLGVLPLGTGNDLARVLGWGSACDDDTQLPQILEKLERASTKMLDRWSIMVYETKLPRQHSSSTVTEDCSEDPEVQHILTYEDSVAAHLSKILTSDQHSVVISSAKVLCETVKDFVAKVGRAYEKNTENLEESEAMAKKCGVLKEKLDSLLKTLNDEAQASSVMSAPPPTIAEEQVDGEGVVLAPPTAPPTALPPCSPRPPAAIFKPREQLMLRANSLKKAIRQIIEHTEKAVDEQNAQTEEGLPSLPAEEEEDDGSETLSLQSSYSSRARASRRASKTPCEKLISKGSLSIGSSASLPAQTGSRENMPMLNTKILYPSLRAGVSGSFSGSVITRLLVNADPFSCDPENLDLYTEKCVMNNYFGIGLDAKISLDFNNKRDEHPEKCRSRTKNMMWYGVLGTKELLHRTYKNLEQRVLLECDGRPIPLPSLQGIAVLNIPSYAGGTNFWGGTKEDDTFMAPSFDDKILEVVAVFGSMQMAVSRVINLQHHRIAQVHIREAAQSHHTIEQELAHAVNASSKAMDLVYANSKSSGGLTCNVVMEMVSNVKALHSETQLLLAGKMSLQLDPPQRDQLIGALSSVTQQLRRLTDISWLSQLIDPADDEGQLSDFSKRSRSAKFRLVPKFKKDKNNKNKETCAALNMPVNTWGVDEVAVWLEMLCLAEYKDIFIRHDIRGPELLQLERRDLKDLGVTKVGHMKRILQGIRDLSRNSTASEA
ncbi:diacylglycerol kinase delta-like [Sinocyclocheilus anshuiensis]|uniref:diacylglycerol kinase delta-like n=1 Tax=Sinocyclocheilus anshuiensis TaxID=1608454 RepID=UPI0007B79B16|nr:PREDICTED: diacylglycerol kinase delta-like [Sinocyclocheilus anshuiensis]